MKIIEEIKDIEPSKKFRTFLSKNKIFFDTLAAISLSLMAVIVAVLQVNITRKQNELIEAQLLVQKQLASPHFNIRTQILDNNETGKPSAEVLVVTNEGGEVYNLDWEIAVFFDVVALSPDKPKEVEIPVSGYFYQQIFSQETTGTMLNGYGEDNFARLNKLSDDFDLILEENGVSWRLH